MTIKELEKAIADETGEFFDVEKLLELLEGKISEDEMLYIRTLCKIDELCILASDLAWGEGFGETDPKVKTEMPFEFDDDMLSDAISTFLSERVMRVWGIDFHECSFFEL